MRIADAGRRRHERQHLGVEPERIVTRGNRDRRVGGKRKSRAREQLVSLESGLAWTGSGEGFGRGENEDGEEQHSQH